MPNIYPLREVFYITRLASRNGIFMDNSFGCDIIRDMIFIKIEEFDRICSLKIQSQDEYDFVCPWSIQTSSIEDLSNLYDSLKEEFHE